MGKTKLLIIIDTLKKGGAEVLLVGILPELNKKYEVILVTLSKECDFNEEQIICSHRYHLGFKGKVSFIFCVFKLNRIIKKYRPSFIQSHLFYSSLAARFVCPSNVPLLYSLHGEMSKNVFNNSKIFTFLEKQTIKQNHSVIAVSNTVLKDYQNTIGKNYNCFVLKNYISDSFFSKKIIAKNFCDIKEIKLVAVGNIKEAKNYQFLLEVFEHLKGYNISLDIYGTGDSRVFQHHISKTHLHITFKDAVNNLHEILPHYDLYVSCSKHEGFGIAAVEAIASGLPLLLSDLPVFHEVTFDNGLFFDLKNPMSFVDLIKEIFEGKYNLNQLSLNGIEIAKQYNKEKYLTDLYSIYSKILR